MKELMKNPVVYYIMRVLFGIIAVPYWIQTRSYDRYFEASIVKALNDGIEFDEIGIFEAKYNGMTLWIENHPYASFTRTKHGCDIPGMCSRLTRYRLMSQLRKDMVNKGITTFRGY